MISNTASPSLVDKARRLFDRDRTDAGFALLEKHVESHPEDEEALQYLASLLHSGKRTMEAWNRVSTLLARNPSDLWVYILAANILSDLGRLEEAKQTIKICLRLYGEQFKEKFPDRFDRRLREQILSCYWIILNEMGMQLEALEVARDISKNHNRFRQIKSSLVYYNIFDEAERLHGASPESRVSMIIQIAYVLCEYARYTEALSFYQRALSYCTLPGDYRPLHAYIQCLALSRRTDEAQNLVSYWLASPKLKSIVRQRALRLMGAVITKLAGDEPSAVNQVNAIRDEIGSKKLLYVAGQVSQIEGFYEELMPLMGEQIEIG